MKYSAKICHRLGWAALILTVVSGCASHQPTSSTDPSAPSRTRGGDEQNNAGNDRDTAGGRYSMSSDAYPLDPPDVSNVPDAVPRDEAPSRGGNRSTYEVWGKTYHVLPSSDGYSERGLASWYGKKFHGYATSNGEIYDMYKMSAAHRSLPLPTYARVTNERNGQSVIVRVNDRGPFHSDREIDLSYAAAARLDILDQGTGAVKVEAIDPKAWQAQRSSGASRPVSKPTPDTATATSSAIPQRRNDTAPSKPGGEVVYLQIAALGDPQNAHKMRTQLSHAIPHDVRVDQGDDIYRVQVGPVSADQENDARKALHEAGFTDVFIVR